MEHENMTATPTPSPKATPTASNADLEQLPVEQVLASLTVEPDQGLSQAEAQKRLSQYGPNAIIENRAEPVRQDRRLLHGADRLRDEAAAVVSAFLGRWDDFSAIAGLLMDVIKRAAYAFVDHTTGWHRRHIGIINQSLQPQVPGGAAPGKTA
jgi:magnesium-transporting ATPase (P-type)